MKSENLNPLSIGPGDQVKDLRPLTYGKAYTVDHVSTVGMFKGWLVMTDFVTLHPRQVSLIKRVDGRFAGGRVQKT
jgi:hypothetical protein